MKVNNDTNDPVDYGQSGGGGGGGGKPDDKPASLTVCQTGHLPANGSASIAACNMAPYQVTFTSGNHSCASPSFTNANATVTLVSITPCRVTVT